MAVFFDHIMAVLLLHVGTSDAVDTAWMPGGTESLDSRCACIYQDAGQIPESMLDAGAIANNKMMKYYGTSCSLWDQMPGTPFYEQYCNTSAGADLCANSFCQASFCFVDQSCPGSVRADSSYIGGGAEFYYSYEACKTVDCYTKNKSCPFDPGQYCNGTDPCACKFQGTFLPEDWYEGGIADSSLVMPLYGTSCSAWDVMPDSPYYATYCDVNSGKDVCAESWCLEKWCYVEPTCPSAAKLENPSWQNPDMNLTLYFSYTKCGNPDCFLGKKDCPYDDPRDGIPCGTTCGELKDFYKDQECCGAPDKMVPKPSAAVPEL